MSKMSSESIHQRRAQIRIKGDFQVYVHGKTALGKSFKLHTLIDNISQGGIYLRLPYKQFAGSKLFTLVKAPSGARIASFGRILRVETKPHEQCGMAVSFERSRIIANPQYSHF